MAKKIRPLYDAVVMLDGNGHNMVAVSNVSAAELYVIQKLHGMSSGVNPLVSVKATGKGVDRSDEAERARITDRYNAPGPLSGQVILNSLYGVGNPLPQEYISPEMTGEMPDEHEEEIVDLEEKKTPEDDEEPPPKVEEPEPEPAPKPEPKPAPKHASHHKKKHSVFDDEDN